MDFSLLVAAEVVESVESVSYFPSWLRESAKRLLFLNQRQESTTHRLGYILKLRDDISQAYILACAIRDLVLQSCEML